MSSPARKQSHDVLYDYTIDEFIPTYEPPPPLTKIEVIDGVEVEVIIPRPPPPQGLALLVRASELYIKLETQWIDVHHGMEGSKKYSIYNERGRRLYYVLEHSNMCLRYLFPRSRPYRVDILDYAGKVAIKVTRKCTPSLVCFCCQCCCNTTVVESGYTGELYGTVKAVNEGSVPTYHGFDGSGQPLFVCVSIEKGFTRHCWGRRKPPFKLCLANAERTQVGLVHSLYTGLGKAIFRKAHHFGAYFPSNIDVGFKVVLLGGMFSIGFLDYPQVSY